MKRPPARSATLTTARASTAGRARLAWIAIVAVLVVLEIVRLVADPSVALLIPEEAHWIRRDEPFVGQIRRPGRTAALFRARFDVERVPVEASIVVRAFRSATVLVNDRVVAEAREPARWKEPVEVDVASTLHAGTNTIQIAVTNEDAHPVLLAHGAFGLATGPGWEASSDGASWTPAARADRPVKMATARGRPRALRGALPAAPVLAIVFVAVAGITLARARGRLQRLALTPGGLRVALLAAFALLAANDIVKLPAILGFDVEGHVAYVRHVLSERRLPLADEGWQMFQPPLFYVLSAPLLALADAFAIEPAIALRVLPLVCGALQIEIAWRVLSRAVPGRTDLQVVGLVVAGLLPVGLYMAQYASNEPLAGTTTAFVVLLCVDAIVDDRPLSWLRAAILGIAVGIALLSKASALLLLPWIAIAFLGPLRRDWREIARPLATLAACALVLAGWYYARNWIELGQPVLGGWSRRGVGATWWQDPSYRVPQDFVRFGMALERPLVAAFAGPWDALYASLWTDAHTSGAIAHPPWNYPFLFACVWLGLPVTAVIVAGFFVRVEDDRERRVRDFVAIGAVLYVAAYLHLFATLPICATGKAAYLLGLTPCVAVLAAIGARPLLARALPRALFFGLVAALGVASYASYFVL